MGIVGQVGQVEEESSCICGVNELERPCVGAAEFRVVLLDACVELMALICFVY
jgi:hypothetical protein